ncbi:hypothetical protein [Armatimonas sp.]|uniref:hypothetical protein n=1 Tax=Armatimonas sp. TaxID=1872638 RepID=UPI003751717C
MPPTMTADYIAEAAQNLSLLELDAIMERLTAIRAHRRVPALSETEADLLKRIEAAVPSVVKPSKPPKHSASSPQKSTASSLSSPMRSSLQKRGALISFPNWPPCVEPHSHKLLVSLALAALESSP